MFELRLLQELSIAILIEKKNMKTKFVLMRGSTTIIFGALHVSNVVKGNRENVNSQLHAEIISENANV